MTFYSKTLLIRGTNSDIRRFLIEACNAKVKKGNVLSFNGDWNLVKGTQNGFVIPLGQYTVISKDKIIVPVHYKQEEDIFAEDFINLSKSFNLDFRLFAFIPEMTIGRNLEVISGTITLNKFFFMKNDHSDDWWPDTAFGDIGVDDIRTFDFPCKVPYRISSEYAELLKTVAEEQAKRYIDTCPCCGKREMLTYKDKTDGWPSQEFGVYICPRCGIAEEEVLNLPLLKWYIFKDNNIDMFLPKGESNGKG